MFGTLKSRFLIILGVIAVAGYFMYSNYSDCAEREAEKPVEARKACTPVKLGLDLQGGMHLVLEVEDRDGTMTPEARADATDRALKIIRTRIDQFGVEEPLVQKVGDDRIIVELPGIDDEERAKQIIQQTAFLEFRLVNPSRELRDALPRIDRAIVQAVGPEGLPAGTVEERPPQRAMEQIFGRAAEDTAAAEGEEAAPSAPVQRPLSALLLEAEGEGEFLVAERDFDRVSGYLAMPEVQRLIPRGTTLRWASEAEGRGAELYRRLYVLEDRPFMTGEYLQDATAGREQQFNQTIVTFEFNRRGGRIFERVTSQNIGRQIAIVLDDEVHSAPVIRSRIANRGQIEMGQAPLEEARDLALVLRAGALPAPLQIMEERTVGPSLGADSVEQGKLAGMIGIAFVVAIMLLYYRIAGALAIGALAVYVILVLGGLAAFNATLTVPGIAGLILSIGMAVDANVLIFERIREELALGRPIRTSVDEGFQNAMSAIVDSNLTTLLTALILFQFGTGPVRGFAVTLSIGIIASFFSAVFVTRALFLAYLERKRAATALSI